MTDNLRARIARATWISHRDRQLAQLGMKPSEYAADIPVPDWAYAIADAVIEALALTQEHRELMDGMCGQTINYATGKVTNHYRAATRQTRYVTEWETTDE